MRVAFLATLATARACGASDDKKKLDTMRRNANNLARAETILTQLIDKQWAERIEAAARDRDRQKRALANFVDAAFARLDADDQTPTAVPTTYPTPSRRCYRYADGAATYYAACGEDAPFLVVDAVERYSGVCAGLDAVDACLAAAQCSVIDENELGGPATCGDAIAGRVYSV
jgi:hypothetical protein